MLDILSIISNKKRQTPSGWYVFNGICCKHKGHSADKRSRAGVKFSGTTNWSYHCFNCQFKCGFTLGKSFSPNLKSLLSWCGLDSTQIEKLSFQSFSQKEYSDTFTFNQVLQPVEFNEVPLPENARALDVNKDFIHNEYLKRRGLSYTDYPFYVVDNEPRQRIIIPYYYKGKIVGNTSRFYDNRIPKYISEQQKGYVFNIDGQKPKHNVSILVEGQFDALSIGGCAFMGNNISDEQAYLLSSLHRKIIFVPDRDKTGLGVCQRALDLGYSVSIPNWDTDVKDVNDAVCKYGKLATLLSIIQYSTTSRIVVELKRKKLL
jgi:hypothetical protein